MEGPLGSLRSGRNPASVAAWRVHSCSPSVVVHYGYIAVGAPWHSTAAAVACTSTVIHLTGFI